VKLRGVELRRIRMPLVTPFRTSFGTSTERDVLLVRVETQDVEGWGECVADASPLYSSEYVDGCIDVLRRFLVPPMAERSHVSGAALAPMLSMIKGHRMAKAALESAVLDAELREHGLSLAVHLGAVRQRVPAGVSVGITDSISALIDAVAGYVEQGYLRIKLKIEPGWDVEPVQAVREGFGDDLLLQVDANAAYRLADAAQLRKLDAFELLMIEQPLAAADLRGHAELVRQLRTPICLDESIDSAVRAADAITMRACSIVNIKPGRVGGLLEARRIHDLCLAQQIPVWCGGMLETGIGRAANVALAALPGFTMPGDTSASSRYYTEDITEPFELVDGHLRVPDGPGIGVTPLPHRLSEVTLSTEWLPIPS
jgi:o-succinylbenzoate synthase